MDHFVCVLFGLYNYTWHCSYSCHCHGLLFIIFSMLWNRWKHDSYDKFHALSRDIYHLIIPCSCCRFPLLTWMLPLPSLLWDPLTSPQTTPSWLFAWNNGGDPWSGLIFALIFGGKDSLPIKRRINESTEVHNARRGASEHHIMYMIQYSTL